MNAESGVFEIVKSILGLDKVSRTDRFDDLGASSLDMTEIFMNLEDKFKIDIPNSVVFDKVGDAVDFVEKAAKKK